MSGFPKRADLLRLASSRKGILLKAELNKLFEVVGLRITAAGLPPHHGLPRDTQQVGQPSLRHSRSRSAASAWLSQKHNPYPRKRTFSWVRFFLPDPLERSHVT